MRKALAICAIVMAIGSIFLTRAEAVDPTVGRGKAISESNFASAGYGGQYRRHLCMSRLVDWLRLGRPVFFPTEPLLGIPISMLVIPPSVFAGGS